MNWRPVTWAVLGSGGVAFGLLWLFFPSIFFDPISRRMYDDPSNRHISLMPYPFSLGMPAADASAQLTRAGYERSGTSPRYSKAMRSFNPVCGDQYLVTLEVDSGGAVRNATGDILRGCV